MINLSFYTQNKAVKYLSVKAFAQAVKVTGRTVRYWCTSQGLPGAKRKSNGYYLIPAHYVEKVLCGELPLKRA